MQGFHARSEEYVEYHTTLTIHIDSSGKLLNTWKLHHLRIKVIVHKAKTLEGDTLEKLSFFSSVDSSDFFAIKSNVYS